MINLKLDSNQTKVGLGVAAVLSVTVAAGYYYRDSIKSLFKKQEVIENEKSEKTQKEEVVNSDE